MAPHKQERRQPKRQSTTQGSAISHQPQQEQFIQRRIKSHLVDLEKDNYIKPGGGNLLRRNEDEEEEQKSAAGSSPSKLRASSTKQKQKKTSANVRQLLMYRKNLETLILESKLSPTPSNPNYLTAQTVPSVYPPKTLCSICGYTVKYSCVRCGSAVCDIGCRDVHDESRCERR